LPYILSDISTHNSLTNGYRLRRTFLLLDPLHGPKSTDLQLLFLLRENCIPHQIILPKVDRVISLPSDTSLDPEIIRRKEQTFRTKAEEILELTRGEPGEGPGPLGDVLGTGGCDVWGDARAKGGKRKGDIWGVQGVRWAVLRACGLGEGTV
jgi:GTP-binding protein